MVGPLAPVAEAALLGRLLLIQGYLHSDLSPRINLTLDRDGTLALSVDANAKTQPALAALRRRLWAERAAMRALPVTRAMRVGKPGRGFHTGGTLPMRARPHRLETDVDGRLQGFSRLHVVDASVLPTLPATTITLSVMANAHRIGAAAVA
jgi:choline dehydrogenase-like flavoprotein